MYDRGLISQYKASELDINLSKREINIYPIQTQSRWNQSIKTTAMIINFDFAFSKHVAVTWLGGNGRVVSGFSGYLFDENLLIGDFSLFEFKLQFIEFRARVSC